MSINEIILRNSLWIKILAIGSMLNGLIMCLTLIGAIVGIPITYASYKLWWSVDRAEKNDAEGAVTLIMLYFKVLGVLILASVSVLLLSMLGFLFV
tara:strand:+ start:133 stop:420 length:288 start_codon:yes stop_codon:yes gene_type:complete